MQYLCHPLPLPQHASHYGHRFPCGVLHWQSVPMSPSTIIAHPIIAWEFPCSLPHYMEDLQCRSYHITWKLSHAKLLPVLASGPFHTKFIYYSKWTTPLLCKYSRRPACVTACKYWCDRVTLGCTLVSSWQLLLHHYRRKGIICIGAIICRLFQSLSWRRVSSVGWLVTCLTFKWDWYL